MRVQPGSGEEAPKRKTRKERLALKKQKRAAARSRADSDDDDGGGDFAADLSDPRFQVRPARSRTASQRRACMPHIRAAWEGRARCAVAVQQLSMGQKLGCLNQISACSERRPDRVRPGRGGALACSPRTAQHSTACVPLQCFRSKRCAPAYSSWARAGALVRKWPPAAPPGAFTLQFALQFALHTAIWVAAFPSRSPRVYSSAQRYRLVPGPFVEAGSGKCGETVRRMVPRRDVPAVQLAAGGVPRTL